MLDFTHPSRGAVSHAKAARPDKRWSARRSLAFAVGVSLALWIAIFALVVQFFV